MSASQTNLTSKSSSNLIINARRTESIDAPEIQNLISTKTNEIYGPVDIINLIERSLLSVTLANESDKIIGHGAFYDYPNIGIDEKNYDWEPVFHSKFEIDSKSTAINSFFMHHFVSDHGYDEIATFEILNTVFSSSPEIHYIYILTKDGILPESSMLESFEPVKITKGQSIQYNLFCAKRSQFQPVLHVRAARVEDQDDLNPIFAKQSEKLAKSYGEFFLAELIESVNENQKCYALESNGSAVGFLSVSTEINYDLLNKCFELYPFHGFRKVHPNDKIDVSFEIAENKKEEIENIESKRSKSNASTNKELTKSNSRKSSKSNNSNLDENASQKSSEISYKRNLVDLQRIDSNEVEKNMLIQKSQSQISDILIKSESKSIIKGKPDNNLENTFIDEFDVSNSTEKKHWRRTLPIPEYFGDGNAIMIQMFAIDEMYELRSLDFLPEVFRDYPDVEYLLISAPHLVPEFPLLQNFVRITPRPLATFPQELYAFHRASLSTNFLVRKICKSDQSNVEKMINSLFWNQKIIKDLMQFHDARRDLDGRELQVFVAECEKLIVGVAIIRREDNIDYIKSHYNIEDFIYFERHQHFEHGQICHFAVNPIFQRLTKIILKEIMRKDQFTSFYYPVYDELAPTNLTDRFSLITALSELVAVRPRRQIQYPSLERLGENIPAERIFKSEYPSAMFHINRKLIMEPKVTINARIIIVGASTTGLAFLERMIFCPHLRFHNLLLVTPNGIPSDYPENSLSDRILGTNYCYSKRDLLMTAIRSQVNIVLGTLTSIDRKKKFIKVNNLFQISYDHLILATGLQFRPACPNLADVGKLATTQEAPFSSNRRLSEIQTINHEERRFPKNMIVINDEFEARKALNFIKKELIEPKTSKNIVIYGDHVEALYCMSTLLSLKIPGNSIKFVMQRSETDMSCLNNPTIDENLFEFLQRNEIKYYNGYTLAQFNESNEICPETIQTVSFSSHGQPIKLQCDAFFCYSDKVVNYEAFRAMNDACLVFDSRLVIDVNFHTNDVSIRGAGTLTKFSRKYYIDQWNHSRFNSKIVGEELAKTMLRLFDPTMETIVVPPKEQVPLTPFYDSPVVQGGILPNELHYLHVAKPRLDIPLTTMMAHVNYGKVLITGSPTEEKGFFRIHINQNGKVETITCLRKKEFPAKNFINLYNIHEKSLNNLVIRFDEKLIDDFFDYFEEVWALAFYHDRFSDFKEEIRELLMTRSNSENMAIEEIVRSMMEDGLVLTNKQLESVRKEFAESGAKTAIEKRLLSFINYNYYHLPVYAKPGLI